MPLEYYWIKLIKNIQGHCEMQFKVITAMNIKIVAFHMLK